MASAELGLAAACGASVLYDLAVALQALEARVVPARHSLRPSLLGRLVRRPRWLLATLLAVLGWPLQVVALLLAPLTLVQPALAAGLILLLVLGVRLLGEPVGRREVAATVAIVAGVAALAWAAPEHTSSHAGPVALAAGLGGIGLLAALPYLRRGSGRGLALWVVLGAGFAYSWTGVSSKLLADELSGGRLLAALGWAAATGLAAFAGLLSEMSALQRRPATQVAPIVFVVQVVVPVAAAPLLGGESWSSTPLGGLVLLPALGLVLGGAVALARSPAVAALIGAAARSELGSSAPAHGLSAAAASRAAATSR